MCTLLTTIYISVLKETNIYDRAFSVYVCFHDFLLNSETYQKPK